MMYILQVRDRGMIVLRWISRRLHHVHPYEDKWLWHILTWEEVQEAFLGVIDK